MINIISIKIILKNSFSHRVLKFLEIKGFSKIFAGYLIFSTSINIFLFFRISIVFPEFTYLSTGDSDFEGLLDN